MFARIVGTALATMTAAAIVLGAAPAAHAEDYLLTYTTRTVTGVASSVGVDSNGDMRALESETPLLAIGVNVNAPTVVKVKTVACVGCAVESNTYAVSPTKPLTVTVPGSIYRFTISYKTRGASGSTGWMIINYPQS